MGGRGVASRLARAALATLLATSAAGPAVAQVLLEIREELDFDRPESWAMKYYGSLALPVGLGVPRAVEAGQIELGLELGWVPHLSAAERTVGFAGTKTEDLNRTPVFGRARLEVGLPGSLSLTLGMVPPVELSGLEPAFAFVALGRPLRETDRWRLGGRLFAQHGEIEGDLTCTAAEAAAGADPVRNPFLCEQPSRDRMLLRAAGAELGLAWRPRSRPRLEPRLALAVSRLDMELRVRARYAGIIDRTDLLTDGTTVALIAGVDLRSGERGRLAVDLFYSPLDVARPPATRAANEGLLNLRAAFSVRLR